MNAAKNKPPRLLGWMLLCAAALPLAASAQRGPNVAEQYLLAMANQERTQRDIQPLAWDQHLAAAALQHAQRMAQENAISHQFPGEPALESRTATAGARFSLVAENVAIAPTPQVLHTEWMHSPGHRANLLEPHENAIGIAVVQSNGELFAVEDFSEQVAAVGLNAQEAQVARLLQGLGMANVQATPDARQSCTMDTGYAGTKRPYFVMRYTTSDLSLLPDELKTHLTDKRIHRAEVGACASQSPDFTSFSIAVVLYP
ncbi:MAG TPA: CAP domain-containing protein [Acidobacteriaceae bacterium]|jgi:hypothetical protein|nr:CAP domain-containing protein [Acidobacteriaceae bacterium]